MLESILRPLVGLDIEAVYLVGSLGGWDEWVEGGSDPFQLLLGLSDEWLLDVRAADAGDYIWVQLTQGRSRAQALADARSPGLWGPHPMLAGDYLASLLGQRITRVRLERDSATSAPHLSATEKTLQLFTTQHTFTVFNYAGTGLSTDLSPGEEVAQGPYWTDVG
ncbi:hypothetical protein [Hymenobacter jeollabukensis]|uniref:Uncharacterized protein n=1 Tax=Hymenobacter jeollabukensis TaxID=2025313 RepID=A0A5R8WVU8_9BACT|nr:hypothetical protein [Hymenobacter jeollabukensis]TLM95555.1 hypothetical protein FDY95_07165 [Hymenobacter jeollabukensis]